MSMFPLIIVQLLIVTGIPALVFLWRYRPRTGDSSTKRFGALGSIIIIATMVLAVGLGAMLPAVFPVVMACVAFICSICNVSSRAAMGWIVSVALLLDLGFLGWWGRVVRNLDEQLRSHPIISLVERLDYERDARSITDFAPIQNASYRRYSDPELDETESKLPNAEHFNAENMKRLERQISLEGSRGLGYERKHMLRSLLQAHYDTSLQFSQALGLGVGRTRVLPYQMWRLDLPEPSAFELPTNDISVNAAIDENNAASIGIDFQPWHEGNLINFANPVSMGLVGWNWEAKRPDLSEVVGFRSHAFRSRPQPPIRSGADDSPWRIDALLLMSLLKQPQPAIYVTNYLPDMQALGKVPTRPLDEFESAALEELKAGEELVVRGGQTQIRMVGSIRAAVQCLECHQVARGTLLGAFSYRLNRAETPSQPELSQDCY